MPSTSVARSLVKWAKFLRLPERPEGSQHYELHDGEVVIDPQARPLQIKLQKQAIAAYESSRPTKLHDRTSDEIPLDEVERIAI